VSGGHGGYRGAHAGTALLRRAASAETVSHAHRRAGELQGGGEAGRRGRLGVDAAKGAPTIGAMRLRRGFHRRQRTKQISRSPPRLPASLSIFLERAEM